MPDGSGDGNWGTVLGTVFGASSLMAIGSGFGWFLRWWREGRVDQVKMLQNLLANEAQEKRLVEAERDKIRLDFEDRVRSLSSDYESRVARMATENGRLHVDVARLNGELKLVYTTMQLMGKDTPDSLDNVVDIVIVSDQDGKIVDLSPSIAFLTGYTRQELLNKPLVGLVPERFRPTHLEGVRRVIESGRPPDPDDVKCYAILTKDNEEVPVDIHISSRIDRSTGKWRFVSVLKRSFRPPSPRRGSSTTRSAASAGPRRCCTTCAPSD
jgi:PAS domain S-box-containing protein